MKLILDYLAEKKIAFELFHHPPVFTCEEAALHTVHLPGAPTKNLFLRDKKGRNHFLLSVSDEKQVDLKRLAALWQMDNLSFASAERLKKYLGVEPGSVTLLGLIHDTNHEVKIFIDEDLWNAPQLQCHPLINTATLVLARRELENFFEATGHSVATVKVPVKA